MADRPGPIHEAQLIFYRPFDVPFSLRIGKFEPWYAKSPGKTIMTHFGYSPLAVTVGANDSQLATSKVGLGTIWYISSSLLTFADFYWLEGGPEGFLRFVIKVLDGEAGIFLNGGSREFEAFRDNYIRPGIDFAIFPLSFVEMSGFLSFAFHSNPSGDGESQGYIASYLEFEIFPTKIFAFVLRGELLRWVQVHEEEERHQKSPLLPKHVGEIQVERRKDTNLWGVLSIQHYIRQNAKLVFEYKANFTEIEQSPFFIGAHFAF